MPWSKRNYPPAMQNLPEKVREKAIDIADALLKDGYAEEYAIPIAISKAKEWTEQHWVKPLEGCSITAKKS